MSVSVSSWTFFLFAFMDMLRSLGIDIYMCVGIDTIIGMSMGIDIVISMGIDIDIDMGINVGIDMGIDVGIACEFSRYYLRMEKFLILVLLTFKCEWRNISPYITIIVACCGLPSFFFFIFNLSHPQVP